MFEDSPIKKILFDKLVEMERLPPNPSESTIQTINDISDSEALQLLRSVGVGPTISKAGGGNPMDELLSRRAMIAGQLNAERGVPGVLGGGINEQKVRVLKIELDRIDRMISMIQGKSEE